MFTILNAVASFHDNSGRFPRWYLWPFKIALKSVLELMIFVYNNHWKKVSKAPTTRAQIVILSPCLSPSLNILDIRNSRVMNKLVVEDSIRVSSKHSIVLKYVFKFDHIILK